MDVLLISLVIIVGMIFVTVVNQILGSTFE